MGYCACENAEVFNYQDGNYGAGTGATVGKLKGMDFCMKSGIGSYAVQIGDLKVGAIVAVNARGDIYDWKDGKKVAGLLNADRKTFADTEEAVYKSYEVVKNKFTGATENTTIGAVITNAAFPKSSRLQDRRDGSRRLCAGDPPCSYLFRRRQHLRAVCGR